MYWHSAITERNISPNIYKSNIIDIFLSGMSSSTDTGCLQMDSLAIFDADSWLIADWCTLLTNMERKF